MAITMGFAWLGSVESTRAAKTSPVEEDAPLPGLVTLPPAQPQRPPDIYRRISVVARNLRSPDGIALDEETGDIYVSEEDANAIVRIRPNGAREVIFDSRTPIYEERDGRQIQAPGLRSPEGLALDDQGTLYVAEDYPGGRLLAFRIRGGTARMRRMGEVVPMPVTGDRYAWESVAVGPRGDLLLAGSTLESTLGQGGSGVFFRGTILYRDPEGEWWMPINHGMASYSAVSFSPDGNLAYFACEVTGSVGCLDLRPRFVRTWFSSHTFRSPEDVVALPGGAVLVAEESGKIHWWDPTIDRVMLLYDHQATIESVRWDAQNRRLLVTDDQAGNLLSLELRPTVVLPAANGRIEDIPFKQQSTPVEMIPAECPRYLADVLKLGGYDAYAEDAVLAFRDFARRYCLIAIDAEVLPLPSPRPAVDPITRIQFVVVAPYLIGFQDGDLIWSASGFTVIQQSGNVVKTEMVQRQVIHGDLMESRLTPMGGQTIAVPIPFSARVDSEGLVSVNFLGLGVMADYYLVLDSEDPDNSVMVVIHPEGDVRQYQVRLPPDKDRSHWVVALERQGADAWKRLTKKP